MVDNINKGYVEAVEAGELDGLSGKVNLGGLWMVLQVTKKGNVVGKPRIVRAHNPDAARDSAFPAPPNHEAVVQCSVFRLWDPYRHVAFDVIPQSAKWGRSRAFDGTL